MFDLRQQWVPPTAHDGFSLSSVLTRSHGLAQQVTNRLWLTFPCPRAGVAAPTVTVPATGSRCHGDFCARGAALDVPSKHVMGRFGDVSGTLLVSRSKNML
jgi:hypothetical protein